MDILGNFRTVYIGFILFLGKFSNSVYRASLLESLFILFNRTIISHIYILFQHIYGPPLLNNHFPKYLRFVYPMSLKKAKNICMFFFLI